MSATSEKPTDTAKSNARDANGPDESADTEGEACEDAVANDKTIRRMKFGVRLRGV